MTNNHENKKEYTLIVSGDKSFSLICEAEQDGMTDYFPGIWSIETQKSALMFARKELARGNGVHIKNYDNPKHYALSNKFIKELGIDQKLFPEPAPLPKTINSDNLKVANLSQLKKYLTPGMHINITNYRQGEPVTRETSVLSNKGDNLVVEITLGTGTKSWFYFGKASEWSFDRTGATKHSMDHEGNFKPIIRIEYITKVATTN
jgi:hypothetical protein